MAKIRYKYRVYRNGYWEGETIAESEAKAINNIRFKNYGNFISQYDGDDWEVECIEKYTPPAPKADAPWICDYSDLLKQKFAYRKDGLGNYEVLTEDFTNYIWHEIKVIKNHNSENLRQVHIIKKLFDGLIIS